MVSAVHQKKIIIIGFFAFLLMLMAWGGICLMRGMKAKNTIVIDEGWTVMINDRKIENTDLGTFYFHNLKRLDTIEISRLITEDLSTGYTAKVKAQFCSVEAYSGADKIYSFGTDEVAKNRFIGNGYIFIELPHDITGKELRIRFIVNEKNSMTDIGSIRLMKTAEAIRSYANANATSVFLNGFVLVFGFALIVLGLFVRSYEKEYLTLILIGAFAFLVGHWANCQGKIYAIFSGNITKLSVHEFVCLYSAPIPLAIYIWKRYIHDGGWREITLRVSVYVLTVFDITACILHMTNLLRFPSTLTAFHAVGGACLVAILAAGVLNLRKEKLSDLVVILAFCEVAVATVLDLIRLNLQKAVFPSNDTIVEVSFLPMGAMLFVIMLTASYLFSLYEMVLSHAERDALTKLAYHDPLTGIYNRAKAKERMEEIDSQDSEVALVNFDVNGLKYVNDHFGHEEGDNLLKGVAETIERCFGEIGTNYRMGGDEFLCVVDPAGIFTVHQAAEKMEKELKELSKNSKFVYSVSYGIAYKNRGEDKRIQDVYAEADEKMYAMKEKSSYSRKALEGNT